MKNPQPKFVQDFIDEINQECQRRRFRFILDVTIITILGIAGFVGGVLVMMKILH